MRHWLWPIAALTLICALGFGARVAIGRIYSTGEAIALLEAMQQSSLFVGSAVATAAATTLALMLTLIGMVDRVNQDFGREVYCNIGRIAKLAVASLMASLVLLLVLAFPVGEFDDLPQGWYSLLYEGLFVSTTITVALLAATITLVYRTVHEVITRVTPEPE